jgi:hypothetical protein
LAVAKIFALLFIIGKFAIICTFCGGTDDPLTRNGNWRGEESKIGNKFVPLGNLKGF